MKENIKHSIKNFNIWWIVFVVMYNALMLIIPSEIDGFNKWDLTFFSALAVVNISFVILLSVVYKAVDAKSDEKIYYNIPAVKKANGTLIAVIIVSTICTVLPNLPTWICGSVNLLIIGFNLLGIIKVNTAADIIEGQREVEKEVKSFIKDLRVESSSIISQAKSDDVKKALVQLNDKLKYADPVSSKAVEVFDDQIKTEFNTIKCLLETNREGNEIVEKVQHLLTIIDERNSRNKFND